MSGAPEAGGWMTTAVVFVGSLIVWLHKHFADRKRKREMESVPPTELSPPPPAHDRALLERLNRAEQHDAIVAALFRGQVELVDERRKNEVLREANSKLSIEAYALKMDNERKDTQLRVERQAVRTLREQLAHLEQELAAKNEELETAHADLKRALRLSR